MFEAHYSLTGVLQVRPGTFGERQDRFGELGVLGGCPQTAQRWDVVAE
jgi:hypothetical protein